MSQENNKYTPEHVEYMYSNKICDTEDLTSRVYPLNITIKCINQVNITKVAHFVWSAQSYTCLNQASVTLDSGPCQGHQDYSSCEPDSHGQAHRWAHSWEGTSATWAAEGEGRWLGPIYNWYYITSHFSHFLYKIYEASLVHCSSFILNCIFYFRLNIYAQWLHIFVHINYWYGKERLFTML